MGTPAGSGGSSGGSRSSVRVLRVGCDSGDLFLRGDRAELRTVAHGVVPSASTFSSRAAFGSIPAATRAAGVASFVPSLRTCEGLGRGVLGDRHEVRTRHPSFSCHGPRSRCWTTAVALGLADEVS